MQKNTGIKHLVEICVKKDVKTIIISPGSRNAPIIMEFSRHPEMKIISIVDERSAAFFALGMAQQSGKTVAIACTSGSALLNYAPAIAEAYYQKIPLLVFSADRPNEWIDQGDSQTIQQKGVFKNFIKRSLELPESTNSKDDLWYSDRLVCEAIDSCSYGEPGPVHINLPFTEPLYEDFDPEPAKPKIINTLDVIPQIDKSQLKKLLKRWNNYSRKLIISAILPPNDQLASILKKVTDDPSVVLMTETTSNLSGEKFIQCIDRVLGSIKVSEYEDAKPELLITFGNQIISKKIKAFLRDNRPLEHWHISTSDLFLDTFQSLTLNIPMKPEVFFSQINSAKINNESNYFEYWLEKNAESLKGHEKYIEQCEYSDLKVFESVLKSVTSGSNLQLGNSTPVRYAQLFNTRKDLIYNSNRGTSGIDGSISTAVGAAYESQKPTTIITGDLGFFYDSNALWNNYLSKKLRIIMINNGGGGIFRFIDGPSDSDVLDLFETPHQTNAKGIAETYGLAYVKASNIEEVEIGLESIYNTDSQKAIIFEIFTPKEKNAEVLKNYFKFLSK